ncbi:3'-5' exonuclease [Marinomonas transparens]|uniref:3'-5' exoribonuclease n=1 Tax=Marinomonas transparens TaxID=2795388 RepID=A0A934N1R0_9GAMM|nr:3'-5' exonuclease [Marinomonas transparens]MBJ7536978.1 3'-5' exoribonuclease [Marinomonas transparens]
MKVIVTDIETKDTLQTAVILSIGAVVVDTDTLTIGETFYCVMDENQPGRTVSESTMVWWEKQKKENPEAWSAAFPRYSMTFLKEGLNIFKEWIEETGIKRPQVFGNGPEFDNMILEHAFKTELGRSAPWDFGSNQSIRTAVLFGRELLGINPKYELSFEGCQHIAISDALHEARTLIEILKAFKGALKTEVAA